MQSDWQTDADLQSLRANSAISPLFNAIERKGKLFASQPKEVTSEVVRHMQRMAPYALFVLMPVFALLLYLIYFRRHRVYGEHLVFTLHVHAFLFFVLNLGFLSGTLAAWLFFLGGPLYLWLAQQVVA
jgi:hypothetical protein